MQEFKKILKSRTILVLLFLIAFNVANSVGSAFDPVVMAIINTILSTVAGYFRINTNVKFDE